MTAAEKAMQEIGEALDAFYGVDISAVDALTRIARANGGYLMAQAGAGK